MRQALRRGRAGIDLDRDLGIRRKLESRPQVLHQTGQFVVGQKGWRAPAKMQLRHGNARAKLVDVQRNFACQRIQVSGGAIVMPGHHLVARAVIANRITKRNVHVQRQGLGRTGGAPLSQRQPIVLFAKIAVIAVGRGIRRIARPVLVQPGQQLRGKKRRGGDWRGRRSGWA
ncbi:hypothetical protein D3C72_1413380 [compost metagenome]